MEPDRHGAGHVASGRPRMDDRDNRLATGNSSWKRRTALYRKEGPVSREIACFVGLDPATFGGMIAGGGTGASAGRRRASAALLVRNPSAIMRPRTPLAAFGLLAGLMIASLTALLVTRA